MLKDTDGWKDITLDFELSAHERAVLAGTIGQEWFNIVQKIFEDVVRKMQLLMANTPPWEEKAVLARHMQAQAAAILYKQVFERIYEQVGVQQVIESGVGSIHNPEKISYPEEFDQPTPPPPLEDFDAV
jgi:hypothetical protein